MVNKPSKKTTIAVLSGKGGTGKTLVAVNLASVYRDAVYIDCDVEEPNGHLFFNPLWQDSIVVKQRVPQIDSNLCTACRACVEFCAYHALALIGGRVKVFEDLCHSCQGCSYLCTQNAIDIKYKDIGNVKVGSSSTSTVISGFLNVGEHSGVPIIKSTLNEALNHHKAHQVIDCPPGSACIVMESIKTADMCLLVAEPTIFGAHNLKMVHELVVLFNKPFAVILNKESGLINPSREYCIENDVLVLEEIPYENNIAQLSSMGKILTIEDQNYRAIFEKLANNIDNFLNNLPITGEGVKL